MKVFLIRVAIIAAMLFMAYIVPVETVKIVLVLGAIVLGFFFLVKH